MKILIFIWLHILIWGWSSALWNCLQMIRPYSIHTHIDKKQKKKRKKIRFSPLKKRIFLKIYHTRKRDQNNYLHTQSQAKKIKGRTTTHQLNGREKKTVSRRHGVCVCAGLVAPVDGSSQRSFKKSLETTPN